MVNNKYFFFLFFSLIIFSCSKENQNELTKLSEIIIGKWEEREQLGFPHLGNEFVELPLPRLLVEFKEDSTITFTETHGGLTEGTYHVNDLDGVIVIDIIGEFEVSISEFSSDYFITDLLTDEGLSRSKYYKLD